MTKKEEAIAKKRFTCVDCGKNTMLDDKDYYMVNDFLWFKYGVGDGMLCFSCLETRMGRKITKADLLDCPLNTDINEYTKKLFADGNS